MNEKIWVVEMQADDGVWFPASFDIFKVLAFNNFYTAHEAKRKQYEYLKRCAPKVWTRKRVRVRLWVSPK